MKACSTAEKVRIYLSHVVMIPSFLRRPTALLIFLRVINCTNIAILLLLATQWLRWGGGGGVKRPMKLCHDLEPNWQEKDSRVIGVEQQQTLTHLTAVEETHSGSQVPLVLMNGEYFKRSALEAREDQGCIYLFLQRGNLVSRLFGIFF